MRLGPETRNCLPVASTCGKTSCMETGGQAKKVMLSSDRQGECQSRFSICAILASAVERPASQRTEAGDSESPAQVDVSTAQLNPNTAARLPGRWKSTWISLPAWKWGFEGGLWFQGMSRVCPGCPQTSPGEEREASCIRDAYAEHPGANAEWGGRNSRNIQHRTSNIQHPSPSTANLEP